MNEKFTFFRSFASFRQSIPTAEGRDAFVQMLIDYALDDKSPDKTSSLYGIFSLIRPVIDKSQIRTKARLGKTKSVTTEEQTENKHTSNKEQSENDISCAGAEARAKAKPSSIPADAREVEMIHPNYKTWNLQVFKAAVNAHADVLNAKNREDFILYWSEKSATGRMRFTLQPTWDTRARMHTWARRAEDNTPDPTQVETKASASLAAFAAQVAGESAK